MKLKKFSTDIFAGIKDQEIVFEDGLNIILGANEAGKSSIINAIFSVIFQEAKIRLNKTEGIEFKERFFPYPDGDHVHGLLCFEVGGKKYSIEKKWSRNNPYVCLELPDGQKLEDIEKIKEYKNKLFLFGRNTFENVVFIKQSQVKNTIENIASDNAVINTVSNFLRKAVMELDGVSVERLNKKIEDELERLLQKWDLENNRPSNPDRDVNNPFKIGLGKIYSAYLKKEQARQKMKKAEKLEKDFAQLTSEVKELTEIVEKVEKDIKSLAEIEDDIFRRGQIEPAITALQEKTDEMKDVNKKWPVVENEVEKEQKEFKKLKLELEALLEEKQKARKYLEKIALEKKIKQIDGFSEEINNLEKESTKYGEISKEKVEKLKKLEKDISTTRASLKAARLTARINYSLTDDIKITKGIEAESQLGEEREFKADGYLRIKTDQIDIEVQAEEIDFEKLQEKYKKSAEEYNSLLQTLNLENASQAQSRLNEKEKIKDKIKAKKERIAEILQDQDYDKLKEKLSEYDEQVAVREIEIIEKEINKLRDEKIGDLKTEISAKKAKIETWQEKYDSHDKLLEKLVANKKEKEELERQLDGLADLPEQFSSPAEFKSQLSALRAKKDKKSKEFNGKKEKLISLENQLPDVSCEEQEIIYQEREDEFKKLLKRAETVKNIKDVFDKKLAEMDENSFKPLVNSFNQYLTKLTAGRYQVGQISEDFQINVRDSNERKLPANMNLLSFGTYDGVALALRFALFENLFADQSGFLVLDDCLVNLDPERTKEAIRLINSFQDKYQIIFTTCNPDTASRLAGNIIEIR